MYIRKDNLVPPTGEYTLCLEGMGRGGAPVLWGSCWVPGCHCSASVLHAHPSSGSLPKWAGHQAPHPPFSVSPSYFLCTEAGAGWAVILLKVCRLTASVPSSELQGAGPCPGDSLACPTCPQGGARLSRRLSDLRGSQSLSACQAVCRPVSSSLEGGSANSLVCFRRRDYPANSYVNHSGSEITS